MLTKFIIIINHTWSTCFDTICSYSKIVCIPSTSSINEYLTSLRGAVEKVSTDGCITSSNNWSQFTNFSCEINTYVTQFQTDRGNYIHKHACTLASLCSLTYICTHMHIHIHTHIHTHIYVCATHIHACTHTYMHAHIHTHTHACTHTHTCACNTHVCTCAHSQGVYVPLCMNSCALHYVYVVHMYHCCWYRHIETHSQYINSLLGVHCTAGGQGSVIHCTVTILHH